MKGGISFPSVNFIVIECSVESVSDGTKKNNGNERTETHPFGSMILWSVQNRILVIPFVAVVVVGGGVAFLMIRKAPEETTFGSSFSVRDSEGMIPT